MNMFWDEWGMPQLEPPPHVDFKGQNGIWILAIYVVRYREKYKKLPFDKRYIVKAIRAHEVKPGSGLFKQNPWSPNDPSSQDNTTAIVTLSYLYDLWFHKETKILGKFWHPKEIIFYGQLKYGKFFKLFDIVMYIIMMESCWKKYKYRYPERTYKNKVKLSALLREFAHAFIPFVKFKKMKEIVHSDGKFLTWIRCATGFYPETWDDCQDIMTCRLDINWRYFIIALYFKNKQHPLFELI